MLIDQNAFRDEEQRCNYDRIKSFIHDNAHSAESVK